MVYKYKTGKDRRDAKKMRHADAGYEKAIEVAKAEGVKIPMI